MREEDRFVGTDHVSGLTRTRDACGSIPGVTRDLLPHLEQDDVERHRTEVYARRQPPPHQSRCDAREPRIFVVADSINAAASISVILTWSTSL